jgi:hypothetical protein
MSSVKLSGSGTLGDRQVYRLGYGAMQLAGPGVFGPPADPQAAIRVLQPRSRPGSIILIPPIFTAPYY